jgi:hypothetical protein
VWQYQYQNIDENIDKAGTVVELIDVNAATRGTKIPDLITRRTGEVRDEYGGDVIHSIQNADAQASPPKFITRARWNEDAHPVEEDGGLYEQKI